MKFKAYQSLKTTSIAAIIFIITGMLIAMVFQSHLAWKTFGWHFITNSNWDPYNNDFGALTCIFGTIVSSLIAILIAIPVSLFAAYGITEYLPRTFKKYCRMVFDVMASIPSIIYGFWGILILVPIMANTIEPALNASIGKIPFVGLLFQGPMIGIGILTAGIVLAIMIIPFMLALLLDIFENIPETSREAAYGLGATRSELISVYLHQVKLPWLGTVILGLGRALGETMAVAFVIGNTHQLGLSLFMPGTTISATIANEFTEALGVLYPSSLFALGLILFGISFFVILVARLLLREVEH